jgi:DNA-binding transcriptional ArsR family regulator
MVNCLDDTFAALADPTRRGMVDRLAQSDATVGQLAQPFNISKPAISKHLRVLERAGLLFMERQGRHKRCRLNREPLLQIRKWIAERERFWNLQLDQLQALLEPTAPASPCQKEKR